MAKTIEIYGDAYVMALEKATRESRRNIAHDIGFAESYFSWVCKANKISRNAAILIQKMYGLDYAPFIKKDEPAQPSLLDKKEPNATQETDAEVSALIRALSLSVGIAVKQAMSDAFTKGLVINSKFDDESADEFFKRLEKTISKALEN